MSSTEVANFFKDDEFKERIFSSTFTHASVIIFYALIGFFGGCTLIFEKYKGDTFSLIMLIISCIFLTICNFIYYSKLKKVLLDLDLESIKQIKYINVGYICITIFIFVSTFEEAKNNFKNCGPFFATYCVLTTFIFALFLFTLILIIGGMLIKLFKMMLECMCCKNNDNNEKDIILVTSHNNNV